MEEVEFKFNKLQFVYFLANADLQNGSKILVTLKSIMGNGQEQILSSAIQWPPEIPLLTLQSPRKYEIRISQGRFDFFLYNEGGGQSSQDVINEKFLALNEKIYSEVFAGEQYFKVRDLGFVITSVTDWSALRLKGLFSDSIGFSFSEHSEIMLRNLEKETFQIRNQEVKGNKITLINRYMTGEGKMLTEFSFDINTLPRDKELVLDGKGSQEFISLASNMNQEWLMKLVSLGLGA